MSSLIAALQKWMAGVQAKHGVNPWIFLGIMTACAPFFYYSIFRMGRAAVKRNAREMNMWGAAFLSATALPYLYVLVFGRNLPWYIYIVMAALVAQGVWSLFKRTGAAGGGGGR